MTDSPAPKCRWDEPQCVAVRFNSNTENIEVRDTKRADADSSALEFTFAEWLDFLEGVRLGKFDVIALSANPNVDVTVGYLRERRSAPDLEDSYS